MVDAMPSGAPIGLADLDTILIEASRLMKQGIRLAGESPGEALDCFDRALALRRRLPIDQVPVLRYDLAACWLNRAEALSRLGSAGLDPNDPRDRDGRGDPHDRDDLHDRNDPHDRDDNGDRVGAAALQAYDEALALLRTLPLDEDPRFVRRLAIACQNRGRVLASRARDAGETRAAVAAFVEAITVLDQHGAGVPDRPRLLAAMWMNAANAWMADADADADADEDAHAAIHAGRAARLAIALVEGSEQQDADAAEVGLHARHVLCRVLAATTLAVTPATAIACDDIHDATDLADDALALVEHWERRGITHFRPLAADLFRFGAHVYAAHQPRFLPEFVQEHLDPARSSRDYVESADLRGAARDISGLRQPVTYYVRLAVRLD